MKDRNLTKKDLKEELPEKRAHFRQLLCVTIRRVKGTSHRVFILNKYRANSIWPVIEYFIWEFISKFPLERKNFQK